MLRPIVALGLAGVAFIVFAAVAIWVTLGDPSAFDVAVTEQLQTLGGPTLDGAFAIITFFGDTAPIIVAFLLAAAWAYYEHARRLAIVIIAVGAASELGYTLVKLLFQRDRPTGFAKVALPSTYSFPSGHAVVAVATYGMLAVAVVRLRPRMRRPIMIVAPLFSLALGASRPYLGAHWPTDVLAGFAFGTIFLVAGIVLLDGNRASTEPVR